MPAIVRKNDVDDAYAPAIGELAQSVFVNGLPVACKGSIIANHPVNHVTPIIIEGSQSVIIEGREAAYIGCKESCKHSRMTGSENTFIKG